MDRAGGFARAVEDELRAGNVVEIVNVTKDRRFTAAHDMSPRQVEMLLSGGLINVMRERLIKESPIQTNRPTR